MLGTYGARTMLQNMNGLEDYYLLTPTFRRQKKHISLISIMILKWYGTSQENVTFFLSVAKGRPPCLASKCKDHFAKHES